MHDSRREPCPILPANSCNGKITKFVNRKMNELLSELHAIEELRSNLDRDVKRDVQSLKKEITRAARLVTISKEESNAKSIKAVQSASTIEDILQDIQNMSADGSKTPRDTKKLQLITRRLSRLRDDVDLVEDPESEVEGPPVVFIRVPREEVLIVDSQVLQEASGSPLSGLESLLDSVFSSSDSIYEDTIRNLREQLIVAHNRNQALELNLDVAEKELEYWRNKNAIPARKTVSEERLVKAAVWKHAVSKFIGSFDQFTMLKALFHWRHYVATNPNSSS